MRFLVASNGAWHRLTLRRMMQIRFVFQRIFFAVVVLAGMILLSYFFRFIVSVPKVDQQAFEQIEIGMSIEDAIKIIGTAPGDYGPGRGTIGQPQFGGARWLSQIGDRQVRWLYRDWAISVGLDNESKIAWKSREVVTRDGCCDWLFHLVRQGQEAFNGAGNANGSP